MYRRKFPTAYRLSSPTRPPNWQWCRVCELIDTGGYATVQYDGSLVCKLVRHLRKLNRLCAEWGVRRFVMREPDVYLALKLAQEAGLRPLEIKGRVLARQTDASIARHLGLPARVVTLFVELYFDVRDRLHARSWIATQVAGIDPRQPPSAESLFLMASYVHGPAVIESWLGYLRDPAGPYDLGTETGRERASIALLVDTHRLRVDAAARLTLTKRLNVIASIPTKSTATPTAGAAVSRNVPTLLARLSWNLDSQAADRVPVPRQESMVFAAKKQYGTTAQAG